MGIVESPGPAHLRIVIARNHEHQTSSSSFKRSAIEHRPGRCGDHPIDPFTEHVRSLLVTSYPTGGSFGADDYGPTGPPEPRPTSGFRLLVLLKEKTLREGGLSIMEQANLSSTPSGALW